MKNIFTSLFLISSISLTAQPWQSKSIVSEGNFYDAQKQFHSYWQNKPIHVREEDNAAEGGYQQFARWENFMKSRAYPSGRIPNPDILMNEFERTKAVRSISSYRKAFGTDASLSTPNWTFMGPHVVPSSGGGAGRINCIAIHPIDHNIMYVGAACGGVWQTTDGGQTWHSSTDQLASISIADIAIDPVNPSNIYVATGDGYGYELGTIFWGGSYTAGVMKSTDGGMTWAQSGLTYTQVQTDIIQRLIINPQNPNILLACTRNGIYRTTNSCASWTVIQSGHFYDMEFNPLNPNTVYAVDNANVWRSVNGGVSFQLYSTNLSSSGRISIAVTAADTNYMYALTADKNFYRSINGGSSFTLQSAPSGTFYGYYDCVLAVSPINKMRVLTGGTNVFMTDNGGSTWSTITSTGTNDYVHPDNHSLAFMPGSSTTFFSGNDGGLFKTQNSGVAWTDLSNGLDIKQYYRLSTSEQNPDIIYAGAQDNGTDQRSNNTWTNVFSGDGMDCLADYGDENTAYVSYQYGAFYSTLDGGQSFTYISPYTYGDWTTPIVQDPTDANTIYIGYYNLYKSTNKGATWTTLLANFTSNMQQICIAPSNHNYIYACNNGEIRYTPNGGTSWVNISAGLPISSAALMGIAVCSTSPQKLWVVCSGYSSGQKVFKSTNSGATWTNVSGTLPNIPVDCIVYQKNSNDELYIGTDFGVYYTNGSLSDWIPYQAGLPNVIVDDIEINYAAGKLRAATYGRGVWESDLATTTLSQTDGGVVKINSLPAVSCSNSISPVITIRNYGLDTLHSVQVNYKIDAGSPLSQAWSGTLPSGQTTNVSLSPMPATAGVHTFTSYTSNPNGVADANPGNDQRISTFEIDNTVLAYPMKQGFETGTLPITDWHVLGAQSFLKIASYGGYGLSTFSLVADCYNNPAASSTFVSRRVNLTSAVLPIRLDFSVAYSAYSYQNDTLKAAVSTDCGATWTTVYNKSGPVLATASGTSNLFTPLSTDWRKESVNLNAWLGFPEVMVRFEAISGYSNQIYIDDINLHDGITAVADMTAPTIEVSPVPFTTTLLVKGGTERLSSVVLTDITGKIVLAEQDIQSVNYTLDTDALSSGVYFIKAITAKSSFVKKVVKQ